MLVNSPFDSSSTKLTIFIKIATPNKRKHVQDRGKRSQKITITKFNAVYNHWVVLLCNKNTWLN